MTPVLAKVAAVEKRGDQYQVIVQISRRYRGSFNTLAFGEIKPHSGSLKENRHDLVYLKNRTSTSQIRFLCGLSIDTSIQRRGFHLLSKIWIKHLCQHARTYKPGSNAVVLIVTVPLIHNGKTVR
jgi:hypothetical protein